MMKAATMGLVVLCVANAQAGYVLTGGSLTTVTNTADNAPQFAVIANGGGGPCAGQWITFPRDATSDAENHRRAFALALLAHTTGSKVNIYNYESDACNRAAYIELTK